MGIMPVVGAYRVLDPLCDCSVTLGITTTYNDLTLRVSLGDGFEVGDLFTAYYLS